MASRGCGGFKEQAAHDAKDKDDCLDSSLDGRRARDLECPSLTLLKIKLLWIREGTGPADLHLSEQQLDAGRLGRTG